MSTQFYGTVTVTSSAATIASSAAHSNNFSVSRQGTGHTRIALNEWVAYQPSVSVTPQLYGDYYNMYACYQVSQSTNQQYAIDIYTAYHDAESQRFDIPYSFALVCGSRLDIDLASGQALALGARIIPFGPTETPVLVLSTSAGDLDRGTAVLATTPDVSVAMTIPATVVYGGTTYALDGYTYAPGLSEPAYWYDGVYHVPVPENTGISSPYQSFRVTAKSGDTILTSDPIAIIKKRGS